MNGRPAAGETEGNWPMAGSEAAGADQAPRSEINRPPQEKRPPQKHGRFLAGSRQAAVGVKTCRP